MRNVLSSIEAELRRYKALADRAMSQLSDEELSAPGPGGGNSVAVVAWHIAGNLRSRFTDFLTTDGEKPWRMREGEFASRDLAPDELSSHWERGWGALFTSLSALADDQLGSTVTIRGVELTVLQALHRALGHVSYHVGQIVVLARAMRGSEWKWLSIPPGGTEAYNRNPTNERAEGHTKNLGGSATREPDAG